ncbi:MAG TPA: tRNA (guanosine(46)-N7)-methyltransferase TrmB [Spirochaetes bacterium]|nr:tRNA (guanosine(46)-N7)-methyltransferase TrmB [Spirochaetota bacterium]
MSDLIYIADVIPPENKEEALSFYYSIFGNRNPITIEIGSGNGHFLVDRARECPGRNFIGTEILNGRAKRFHSKIEKRALENIVVFKGDARRFVWEFLFEQIVSEFIILFPDPWPKKRHHKHRLLKAAFINMLHYCLVQGGTVTLATDFPEYRELILEEFKKNGNFQCTRQDENSLYPDSYSKTLFQERFEKEGREIYFLKFRKKNFIR